MQSDTFIMNMQNKEIDILKNELQIKFIHSSGPGGQNVNKVATAVQLRFNVINSQSLPQEVKERLKVLAKNRINEKGELVLESRRYRTQHQNRKDVLEKFKIIIEQASVIKKPRIKTKPTITSQYKRLEQKQRRSKIKKLRQKLNITQDDL